MKKIFVRYNQLGNLPKEYQDQVRHLSNFYQQLPFDHDFTVIDSTDLDETFQSLREQNPDWVVVVSLGHCTQNRNLYDELIAYANQNEFKPLVAHILNFPDQFPHIHPQLFVIHYPTWVSVKSPVWAYDGQDQTFVGTLFESSAECHHDEYTPHWIKSRNQPTFYHVPEMQTGARVLHNMLMHGHTIYNIPDDIRNQKFHLYPDQCWPEFQNFLNGSTYSGDNTAQKHYAELIGHLTNQVQKQYYVLNTEPLTDVPANIKIDHYAGVASGLKLFCTMVKNGFDTDTAVTVFDFSDIALDFQKYLKANWDGDLSQYQMVCKVFEDSTPGNFPCLPGGAWSDYYDHMLSQLHMTALEFQVQWNRYRRVNTNFQKLNLYDAGDQIRLAEVCGQYKTNYVWISNAFYMEYSLIKLGLDQLKEIRANLFTALDESNALVILDTNDHWDQKLLTFNHNDTSSN